MRSLLIFSMVFALRAADPVDPVVDRLSHVEMFAFGGVGIAAITTKGERDYDSILARPTPEIDFEKVFAGKSPAAKAYALVAIRKLDAAKFKALTVSVKSSNDIVRTGRGCLITTKPLGEVVKRIEAGIY